MAELRDGGDEERSEKTGEERRGANEWINEWILYHSRSPSNYYAPLGNQLYALSKRHGLKH